MSDAQLKGSPFSSQSKLEELRQKIYSSKFQELDEIRNFVNRYVIANPEEIRSKSSPVDELADRVRSELGLTSDAQPAVTHVISEQVRNLILGRAQASEDTARWAVHHAANQVTMYSGQFIYTAKDIFIDGAGMNFVFRRTYKSQGYYNGPLGINWDHNYNQMLRTDDEKIIHLTGGFQENQYIKHEGFNYWVPPPGEHSIIFDVANVGDFSVPMPPWCQGCQYGLRLPEGTVYYYKQDQGNPMHYYVKCIVNRFGNFLEFNYDEDTGGLGNLLKEVFIDNPYRKVVFEYDFQGRINCIKDYIGRVWRYTYDDYGDLIAFTTPATDRYPEGLTERYVYSTPYYSGELQHKIVQVYDTAGRMYLENEYGTDSGLLSFNRMIRQREGNGERFFEYEDISLATGLPVGQPEIEEDLPAYQTVMVRHNGHPIHYIYNKFGNLIAQEEDAWASGLSRRLVTHYRYNRDGSLTGEISPEGRITQYLYGRDEFIRSHQAQDLTEDQLSKLNTLTWQERLSFGDRLAIVQRGEQLKGFFSFQFPSPLSKIKLEQVDANQDIITKFAYDDKYQNVTEISHPMYTKSPLPNAIVDNNQKFKATRTKFIYDQVSGKLLKKVKYPDCTRDGQLEIQNIEEKFLTYDQNGRLTEHADRADTHIELSYFPAPANSNDPNALKEGYLHTQTIDPKGLNLKTEYQVNEVGIITQVKTPKDQVIRFKVDSFNRVAKVTRTLKQGVDYRTRYAYCRNMRVERIERDVQDEEGQPLWGGTEVQFFHYDENDNVSRQQIGSIDFNDHLVTRHTYDDGDLRVKTTLPRGNSVYIDYDERRQPVKITRGVGSAEMVTINVVYDGDGLITEHRDGRGLKTEFMYDSFGRVTKTQNYDEKDELYRLIRQDYDKAGNLTNERVFIQENNSFKLLSHNQYIYNELNQRIEVRFRRFQTPIVYNAADVDREDDDVPLGEAVRTLYFYDKAGRLTRVEQHGRRMDAGGNLEPNDTILTSSYAYNAVGWLASEKDPLGNETKTHYDKHGLMKRVDVCEKVSQAYSTTGQEVFTTLYDYDSLDRLASVKDGLGNETSFEYDSRDAIIRQIDPLKNVTRFEYDVYGRQVAECIEMTVTGLGSGPRHPNSDIVTQYIYDANGNLIKFIDAHSTPTEQAYDALDRHISVRYADGTATTYRYDGNDNLVWTQDNNGLIRRTTYDPLDKPIEVKVDKQALLPGIVVEGTNREVFEYDALGQMTGALAEDTHANWWHDIRFKLDSFGRIFEESTQFSDVAQTIILKRQYDDFGFLRRVTCPNGRTLLYHPDALNRIHRIDNQTYGVNYPGHTNLSPQRMILQNEYRGLRIGRKRYGNGANTSYAYDGAARVTEIAHINAQNTNLLTLQHLYDDAGNMRFKYEYLPSGQPHYGEVYKYDSRRQLTQYKEVVPPKKIDLSSFGPAQAVLPDTYQFIGQTKINKRLGKLAQVSSTFTYKYDKLGNRLEEQPPSQEQTIAYIPNKLNQYIKRGHTQYTYDPNGNLSHEQSGSTIKNYFYNHRNQIARVTAGGGKELTRFRYDALGRRVSSQDPTGVSFCQYDGENVLEEYRFPGPGEQPQVKEQYVNETETDSRCHLAAGGLELWYHKDLVGSTRVLTENNGDAPCHYRFSPFGVWSPPGALPASLNSYLFSNRQYERVLGSYDFRIRTYSPELGRFLQRDAHESGSRPEVYLFVHNSPLATADPSGREDEQPSGYQVRERVLRNRDVQYRNYLIAGMQVANKKGGCCSYPATPFAYVLPKQWVHVGGLVFMPNTLSGVEPSEAISSIFDKKDSSQLDCLTMMIAVQYRAMLELKGKEQFNLMFGEHGPYGIVTSHQILEANKLIRKVSIKSESFTELKPGDWVYFQNFPDYSKLNPQGFWAGLHALYVGKGQFQGFGLTKPMTAIDIGQMMIDQYAEAYKKVTGREFSLYQKLVSSRSLDFGMQRWVYRPVIENIMKEIPPTSSSQYRLRYRDTTGGLEGIDW